MNTQEREISLFDLLIYVAKGWRGILACMLAASLLNGGVSYAREIQNVKQFEAMQESGKNTQENAEENTEEAKQAISLLRKEMPEEEVEAVDKVFYMEKEYDQQQKFVQSSLLLGLDARHICVGRLQYMVDTAYEIDYSGITKKDYAYDAASAYLNRLRDSGWKKKAMQEAGIGGGVQYFSELISMELGGTDNIFSVTIKYDEENKLRRLMAAAAREIEGYQDDVKRIFGPHALKEAGNSVDLIIDNDIYNTQQNWKNTMASLKDNIVGSKASFNDDQKSLYAGKIIISEKEEGMQENTDSAEGGETEEEILPPPVPALRVKNLLLGAVLGAFLICALRAMCYILSGKLKPEDDIDVCFGVPRLGFIGESSGQSAKKACRLDAWLEGLSARNIGGLSKEQQMQMIVSNIALYCKCGNMKNIYFNSSINCAKEKAASLSDMLREKGILTEGGFSVLQDAAAMEDMGKADGVVFVEQAGKSRYGDMEREIKLCREHEKNIIGMVVLL